EVGHVRALPLAHRTVDHTRGHVACEWCGNSVARVHPRTRAQGTASRCRPRRRVRTYGLDVRAKEMTDVLTPVATGMRNLGFQFAQRPWWLATRVPLDQHGERLGVAQRKATNEPAGYLEGALIAALTSNRRPDRSGVATRTLNDTRAS